MLKRSNATSPLIYLPSSMSFLPLPDQVAPPPRSVGPQSSGLMHVGAKPTQKLGTGKGWCKCCHTVYERRCWQEYFSCHHHAWGKSQIGVVLMAATSLRSACFLPSPSCPGLGQLGFPWHFALHRGRGTASHHALGASWTFGTSQGIAPFCCTAGSA